MLFGLANGLGYGFVLQLSARTGVVRPAAAMALVTAGYALGATGFAFLLTHWQVRHGVSGALMRQAGVVFFSPACLQDSCSVSVKCVMLQPENLAQNPALDLLALPDSGSPTGAMCLPA